MNDGSRLFEITSFKNLGNSSLENADISVFFATFQVLIYCVSMFYFINL